MHATDIDLDQLQGAYKAAVDDWIAAIRHEEALATPASHSVADIDAWEKAHFAEDALRVRVKAAKSAYEDALRKKFFNF